MFPVRAWTRTTKRIARDGGADSLLTRSAIGRIAVAHRDRIGERGSIGNGGGRVPADLRDMEVRGL
jgi:hypothetical protein